MSIKNLINDIVSDSPTALKKKEDLYYEEYQARKRAETRKGKIISLVSLIIAIFALIIFIA